MKDQRSLAKLWLGIRLLLILAGLTAGRDLSAEGATTPEEASAGIGLLMAVAAGLVALVGTLGMRSMFVATAQWHRQSWTGNPFTEAPQFLHAISFYLMATGFSQAVVSWRNFGGVVHDSVIESGAGIGFWLGLAVAQRTFRRAFLESAHGDEEAGGKEEAARAGLMASAAPTVRQDRGMRERFDDLSAPRKRKAFLSIVGFMLLALVGAALSILLSGLPSWLCVILFVGGLALWVSAVRNLG